MRTKLLELDSRRELGFRFTHFRNKTWEMAALDASALGKRKPHEAQSIDTVRMLQDLERRAAEPRYKFMRKRLPDIWNQEHPGCTYPSAEDMFEHEGDACIPFFTQYVLAASLTPESRKTYLNGVKQLGRAHFSPDGLSMLDGQIKALRAEVRDLENRNECNSVDDANWIPWTEVVRLFNDLTVRMFVVSDDVPYETWQCFLLFAMYVLQPPLRNDYSCVRLGIPDLPPSLLNLASYIDLKASTPYFHLGHDKVVMTHGTCNIPLDPMAVVVITSLEAKFGKREYLLTMNSSQDLPLERTNFNTTKMNTARLWTRLSELVGHPLNVCMLRSSYATWLLEQPNLSEAEIIKAAACMRTSPHSLRTYYRKIKPATTPPPSPSLDAAAAVLCGPSSLSDF